MNAILNFVKNKKFRNWMIAAVVVLAVLTLALSVPKQTSAQEENTASVVLLSVAETIEASGSLDAQPFASLTGRVSIINPVGEVVSGLVKYTIRVSLDETQETAFVPLGTTANVTIKYKEEAKLLAVPITTIQNDDNGEYVWVGTFGVGQKHAHVHHWMSRRADGWQVFARRRGGGKPRRVATGRSARAQDRIRLSAVQPAGADERPRKRHAAAIEGYYLGHGSWDGVEKVLQFYDDFPPEYTILLNRDNRIILDSGLASASTVGSIYEMSAHDIALPLIANGGRIGALVVKPLPLTWRGRLASGIILPIAGFAPPCGEFQRDGDLARTQRPRAPRHAGGCCP